MRPFKHTIPFAEALRVTLEAAQPISRTETVATNDADGRVLARDVVSAVDVPGFDRAAMDGYAVRAADTAGAAPGAPRRLTCRSSAFAGEPAGRAVGPGECAEIATGAPIPQGADAVVMVEHTERDGDVVYIQEAGTAGQHVGKRAGDLARGSIVAHAGQTLTPAGIGAIAAAGVEAVTVYARPTVALVTTGNEIVEPGTPLGPGQVYDVNSLTLGALVARHGGDAVSFSATGDAIDEIGRALTDASHHDIIVFSGGSSVGDRDLVLDVLRARGEVLFHGIAVKPGKPTAVALVGRLPVFAMPGNPTSCLSNGYLLLVPFLRRVARLEAWQPRVLERPLAHAIRSAADRHQFYTVRVMGGQVEAAFRGSSAITSMAHADGYIEIPAGTEEIPAGTIVRVTCF
ncbi:MAG TPA: gephyrin-like molybdotransferase Glp [Vicinamibacterales bacterium]|nr:gephyrin-like molybdotransferase Glp [Vicinamibacterales bacterium]